MNLKIEERKELIDTDNNLLLDLALLRLLKLNSLEELLIKLTHDINNLLSVVQLEMDVLNLNSLQVKIIYIASVIRVLQAYCNPNKKTTIVEINNYIENALQLYQPLIKIEQIEIVSQLNLLPHIKHLDAEKMEQVIVNLLFTIIKLANAHIKKHIVKINTRCAKKMIYMRFESNNCKIPLLQIRKLLKLPLVTLVIENETIFNLAICKQILTQYHCRLMIRENDQGFMQFLIKIPL